MEIIQVENSSNITGIGYAAGAETLRVIFKDGKAYDYEAVPSDKWEAFQAAQSKGKYLAAEIKPHHSFQKLEPEE